VSPTSCESAKMPQEAMQGFIVLHSISQAGAQKVTAPYEEMRRRRV